MKSVLIFGSLPPPIGGVRTSVLNLKKSLESVNIDNQIFSIKNIFLFKRFDIGHINFTKKWKIVVAILLGKLLCKKVILTPHGETFYKKKRYIDRFILYSIDGLIALNDEVFERCHSKENRIKLPPVFVEGFQDFDESKASILDKKDGEKYILLYAYGKVFEEGIEVYGCQFILNLIKKLPLNYRLVFVDPKGEYASDIDIDLIDSEKIVYLNKYVDFKQLLLEVDVYIRPTNFDGNSIATLEALGLGVPVLASDVVDRNSNVTLYTTGSESDFLTKLDTVIKNENIDNNFKHKSIVEYIDFCNKIMNK